MTNPFVNAPGNNLSLSAIPTSQTVVGTLPGLVLGYFADLGVVDVRSIDIGGGLLVCEGTLPIDLSSADLCSGVTIDGDILFREETAAQGKWDIRMRVEQRNVGTDALEVFAERSWGDFGQDYGWRRTHTFTDLTVPFSGFASDILITLRYTFLSNFTRQTSPTNVFHAVQLPRLTIRKLTVLDTGAQTARALHSTLPVPGYSTLRREASPGAWRAEIGYGRAAPPTATSNEDWDVFVNDVKVYTGLTSTNEVSGWTVTPTIEVTGITSIRTSLSYTIAPDLTSATLISPNTSGNYVVKFSSGPLSETHVYTFASSSVDNMVVVSGRLVDPYKLEVQFSDDVDLSTTALNAASYSMIPVNPPTFVPFGVTTEATSPRTIVVTFDEAVTMQADYKLEVSQELEANDGLQLDTTDRDWFLQQAVFRVGTRNIDLFSVFPDHARCADVAAGGDLKVITGAVDDAMKYLYLKMEEQQDFAQPTTAPLTHLDIMLNDAGNFFSFQMLEDEKRRLLEEIGYFQENVGLQKGIEGAVRFFTGIAMTVLTVYDQDVWVLNQDPLNDGTVIALGLDSPDWLAYNLQLPAGVGLDDVTAQDRLRITVITRVMGASYAEFRDIVEQ